MVGSTDGTNDRCLLFVIGKPLAGEIRGTSLGDLNDDGRFDVSELHGQVQHLNNRNIRYLAASRTALAIEEEVTFCVLKISIHDPLNVDWLLTIAQIYTVRSLFFKLGHELKSLTGIAYYTYNLSDIQHMRIECYTPHSLLHGQTTCEHFHRSKRQPAQIINEIRHIRYLEEQRSRPQEQHQGHPWLQIRLKRTRARQE